MNERIRDRICLALDGFDSTEAALERVRELKSHVGMFKVGLELYSAFGPGIVQMLHDEGVKVFLDLKLHDIPKTVENTSRVLSRLKVALFNVHASGGTEMMRAALEGCGGQSKVIGVTVLTSWAETSFRGELGVSQPLDTYVLGLAKLAEQAGLQGVVCSAQELELLKPNLPQDFVFITPGISGSSTRAGADQKRVFTPAKAVMNGATHLVIGRAINGLPGARQRIEELELIHGDLSRVL
ncbi:MAG: orotidine-5'-phosphate decarboxylase [Oligoflexia bacterium]|nr:orotidine-5'-phosphate decarboxylase [Oligoflexia bacterium]